MALHRMLVEFASGGLVDVETDEPDSPDFVLSADEIEQARLDSRAERSDVMSVEHSDDCPACQEVE